MQILKSLVFVPVWLLAATLSLALPTMDLEIAAGEEPAVAAASAAALDSAALAESAGTRPCPKRISSRRDGRYEPSRGPRCASWLSPRRSG